MSGHVQVPETDLQTMIDMGFNPSDAHEALVRGGNVHTASILLCDRLVIYYICCCFWLFLAS